MRTTVTLDPDVEQMLRERMQAEGVSFKKALNDAVRAGVAGRARPQIDFVTNSVSLGRPMINLDKALQLVAEDEDESLMQKMRAAT